MAKVINIIRGSKVLSKAIAGGICLAVRMVLQGWAGTLASL